MLDSIGHHRRFKAGREVKVSAVYLGGLAVSDKHGTVVTSANTTRTTGRTARSPMRSYGSYEVYESTWSEEVKEEVLNWKSSMSYGMTKSFTIYSCRYLEW